MSVEKSRRWIWILAFGILLGLFGLYDELGLAFIREGCITGVAWACRAEPTVALRAHGCVLVGFALVVAASVFGFGVRRARRRPQ